MKARRWGSCRHCEQVAFHKCRRCGYWLCAHTLGAPCGRLRKVRGQVGRYDLVCWPRCRKTRRDVGRAKTPREHVVDLLLERGFDLPPEDSE